MGREGVGLEKVSRAKLEFARECSAAALATPPSPPFLSPSLLTALVVFAFVPNRPRRKEDTGPLSPDKGVWGGFKYSAGGIRWLVPQWIHRQRLQGNLASKSLHRADSMTHLPSIRSIEGVACWLTPRPSTAPGTSSPTDSTCSVADLRARQ